MKKLTLLSGIALASVAMVSLTGCALPTPTASATIQAFASEGTVLDLTHTPSDKPYFVAANDLLTGVESNDITLGDLQVTLSAAKLSSNSVPVVAISLKNALNLISAQVGTNAQASVGAYVTPLQQGIAQGLQFFP